MKPIGWLIIAGMLGMLLLGGWSSAQAGAASSEVARLLGESRRALDLVQAERKLDEAEDFLEENKQAVYPLEAGLLAADILQTRGQVYVAAWDGDETRTDLRDKARKPLLRALDRYVKLQKECEDELDAIENRLGRKTARENSDWKRIKGYISRANYDMGWTEHSLGVSFEKGAERQKHLENADTKFVAFTARGYTNNPIVVNCYVGRVKCLYELGRSFEIPELINPKELNERIIPKLRKDATPENIYLQKIKVLTLFLLKAYEATDRIALEDTAADYLDELHNDHTYDGLDLQMALVRLSNLRFLCESKHTPETLRDNYKKTLRKTKALLRSHGTEWSKKAEEALGQPVGGGLSDIVEKANEHFDNRDYETALELTEEGLKDVTEESDPVVVAHLRFIKAAIYWNQKAWRKASLTALDFLQHHGNDDRASETCSRALRAALNAKPPLPADEFGKIQRFAKENFPDLDALAEVPWYRARMLVEAKKYAEAESLLEEIPETSPLYRRALYRRAFAAYKQAEDEGPGDEKNAVAVQKLLERSAAAVRRFIAVAPQDAEPSEADRELAGGVRDVAMATVERMLLLPKPDHKAAAALLEATKRLDGKNNVEGRRMALHIAIYVASGDFDKAADLIDDLLEKDPGANEKHTVRTLAGIAGPLEAQYDRLTRAGETKPAERVGDALLRIYPVVLTSVKRSKDKDALSQEASVRRCLAKALLRTGKHQQALPHYRWAEKKVPRKEAGDVYRGLAVIYEKTREYALAIEYWRKLVGGLKKETDGWFEAKYRLIDCLRLDGRADYAKEVLDYFIEQCPPDKLGPWAKKFSDLQRKLKPNDGDGPAARPSFLR